MNKYNETTCKLIPLPYFISSIPHYRCSHCNGTVFQVSNFCPHCKSSIQKEELKEWNNHD